MTRSDVMLMVGVQAERALARRDAAGALYWASHCLRLHCLLNDKPVRRLTVREAEKIMRCALAQPVQLRAVK
jgi:hypothetical protein